MQQSMVTALANTIESLSTAEQQDLYWALLNWIDQMRVAVAPKTDDLKELRETRFAKGVRCPHCGSESIYRWGCFRIKQRYRCRKCHKTFSDLTKTPFSYCKYQDKWELMAACMAEGISVRKTAEFLHIHPSTAFRWRHRILAGMSKVAPPVVDGIVEADEAYFRRSFKGQRKDLPRPAHHRGESEGLRGLSRNQVCVFIIRDRQKRTVVKVSPRLGQPDAATTASCLLPVINKADCVLVSDQKQGYPQFCKAMGLHHFGVGSKKGNRVHGIYHVQNVNAYTSRFKEWLIRFHGVASKYLPNYSEWHVFLDRMSKMTDLAVPAEMLRQAAAV